MIRVDKQNETWEQKKEALKKDVEFMSEDCVAAEQRKGLIQRETGAVAESIKANCEEVWKMEEKFLNVRIRNRQLDNETEKLENELQQIRRILA